jgi:hypothetical protein
MDPITVCEIDLVELKEKEWQQPTFVSTEKNPKCEIFYLKNISELSYAELIYV